MRTLAEIGANRLVDVLVKDKNESPARIIGILKSEITNILCAYAELDDEIEVKMQSFRGRLKFEITAVATRVKDFGHIAN